MATMTQNPTARYTLELTGLELARVMDALVHRQREAEHAGRMIDAALVESTFDTVCQQAASSTNPTTKGL